MLYRDFVKQCTSIWILLQLNTGQYGAQYIGNDLNVEPAWMQGVTGCNVTTVVVDDGMLLTRTVSHSLFITVITILTGMNIKHSDLWDNFVSII